MVKIDFQPYLFIFYCSPAIISRPLRKSMQTRRVFIYAYSGNPVNRKHPICIAPPVDMEPKISGNAKELPEIRLICNYITVNSPT